MSTTKDRHPDLLTSEDAAAYMGVSRLDKLPEEFRPQPLPYNERLYHRSDLDEIISRAAKTATGKRKLRLA